MVKVKNFELEPRIKSPIGYQKYIGKKLTESSFDGISWDGYSSIAIYCLP